MKVTRASIFVDQLIADGWEVNSKFQLLAQVAGIIFGDPTITDEEIGAALVEQLIAP